VAYSLTSANNFTQTDPTSRTIVTPDCVSTYYDSYNTISGNIITTKHSNIIPNTNYRRLERKEEQTKFKAQ
jgi:hypothetical protein